MIHIRRRYHTDYTDTKYIAGGICLLLCVKDGLKSRLCRAVDGSSHGLCVSRGNVYYLRARLKRSVIVICTARTAADEAKALSDVCDRLLRKGGGCVRKLLAVMHGNDLYLVLTCGKSKDIASVIRAVISYKLRIDALTVAVNVVIGDISIGLPLTIDRLKRISRQSDVDIALDNGRTIGKL